MRKVQVYYEVEGFRPSVHEQIALSSMHTAAVCEVIYLLRSGIKQINFINTCPAYSLHRTAYIFAAFHTEIISSSDLSVGIATFPGNKEIVYEVICRRCSRPLKRFWSVYSAIERCPHTGKNDE